jgi:CRP-like cAMP-binding protein
MSASAEKATPLVARFERLFALTELERQALQTFPLRIVELAADQDVVREGDRPSRSALLIEGVASTSKVTIKGKRQIMAFHIAGNMPDLQSLHLGILDSDLRTITPCTIGFMDHSPLKALCRDHPRIAASLWRTTLVDASVYREWLANIGQREAFGRLAHVFCEMMSRMDEAGLAEGKQCALPVTQVELGEATGMSSVHVNRTLQELRGANLITFGAGMLTIHNWERLAEAGEFDPTYLHLGEHQMAA